MTHRGLFFCADETCCLGPEKWRAGLGLCLKHALQQGWVKQAPELNEVQKLINKHVRKSFLTRLLEGLADNNIDGVLDNTFPYMAAQSYPKTEPVPHWSEYRETPF